MTVLEVLRQRKEELQQVFGIQRIGLVKPHKQSQIQDPQRLSLVIEFGEITSGTLMQLKSFLEGVLGYRVDLATSEKPIPRTPITESNILWW